jgi:hypothetical protein
MDEAWRPNLEASPGEIAAKEDFDLEASKE